MMNVVTFPPRFDWTLLAALPGFLTWLYLLSHEIRGDTCVLWASFLFVVVVSLVKLSGSPFLQALIQCLSILTTYVSSVVFFTVAYRLSPFHPLAKYPGPVINKVTSLKMAYTIYTGKRHLIVTELHKKYGIYVRTGPNTLSINSTAATRMIYTAPNCMDKSTAYRVGRLGEGGLLFMRRREVHNRRRRMWAAAFNTTGLEYASVSISKRTRQLISLMDADHRNRKTIDLTCYIQRWGYDVMGDLTFGGSSRLELLQEGDREGIAMSVQNATKEFTIYGEIPALFDILWYFPSDVHVLERLGARLLTARKGSKSSEPDICSHLLKSSESSTDKLSDIELKLDSILAVQAGSDPIAGVLTLLIYYIIADRDVYDRLTEELDRHFLGRVDDHDHKTLLKLPYLSAVVQESLRLGTPFTGLPRVVPPSGVVLEGAFIPGNTIVSVPAYAQQTSPTNFWPQPLEFRPDRWLPGGLGPDNVLNKSAIMCFGSGPFGCLGKTLAIQELHIFTAQLLSSFDIRFAHSFDPNLFRDGISNMRTTVFSNPLLVEVIPRKLVQREEGKLNGRIFDQISPLLST